MRCDRPEPRPKLPALTGADDRPIPAPWRPRRREPPPDARAATPSRTPSSAVGLSALGVLLVVVAGRRLPDPPAVRDHLARLGDAARLVGRRRSTARQTYPHARATCCSSPCSVSTHDPNVWRVVTSWLDPDRDVEKRNDVVGCLTDAENQSRSTRELMDQSQNDAKDVALTRLGYTVHGRPARRSRVVEVCRGRAGVRQARGRRPGARGRRTSRHRRRRRSRRSCRRTGPATTSTSRTTATARTRHRDGRGGHSASKDRRIVRAGRAGRPRAPPASASTSQEFVTYQFPINVKIDTAAGRRAVGRARLHARDHRRPHARAASPAASGSR